MKLKIVNLHPGLIDPQSKAVVPLDRQVYVNDIAFWRRRCEQGHCELLAKMTDAEAAAEVRSEAAANVPFEKAAREKKAAPKKTRRVAKKATAESKPKKPTDESEG